MTWLPGSKTLTLPLGRRASVRLTPVRASSHVLLEIRGPSGGDLGGLVLDGDTAHLLADGLTRLADGGDASSATSGPPDGEVRAARAHRRSGDLASVLTTTLDPESTLVGFARLAVPVFADWCTVDVATAGSVPRRLGVMHADTSKRKAASTLARYPHAPRQAHPRSAVWATGQVDLAPEVPDARLVAAARSKGHLSVLRALGCRSSMAVPLLAGPRVFGVMTFALAESHRSYTDAEIPLASTLARCAGLAAENARLYREAHQALRPRIGSSPTRRRQGQ